MLTYDPSSATRLTGNTHAHVTQEYCLVSQQDSFPAALRLIEQEKSATPDSFKIMVFLPTARATGLAYEVFRSLSTWPPSLEFP
jgi:hypothetical protein